MLKGIALSAALQQAGRFSLYEVYSIQISEETGKMIEVLQELARFYTNKIKQRRKTVSALTYPIVVVCTSLGAVFFMLKFLVPMFGDVFKRFGGQLSWITEKIISKSQMLERFFWPVVLFTGALRGVLVYFCRSKTLRRIWSKMMLRIPVVGNRRRRFIWPGFVIRCSC